MSIRKITRELLFSCLIALPAILLLTSCELPGIGNITDIGAEKQSNVYIGGRKTDIELPVKESGHYSVLSAEQKYIYAAALKAVELGENKLTFTEVDHKEYLEIYADALTAMISDHPEFFWLSGEAAANSEFSMGSDKGKVTLELSLHYHWESADLDLAKKDFDAASKEIINEASAYEDIFDRVKFVHDSIVTGAEYDRLSYETGSSALLGLSNSAYGALVEGRALCGGYSRAFSHIMHELGIETFYVTGEADGGPHAWNVIKLGGEYYHIDLTWNDTDKEDCPAVYSYFCITSEEIERTHTVDKEFSFLKAESKEYNYHIRKSLYIEDYSYEAVKKLYDGGEDKKVFSLKFANSMTYEKAMEDLIDDHSFAELISSDDFVYFQDEKQFILTFIIS